MVAHAFNSCAREAEADGSLFEASCSTSEFQDSQGYVEILCFKKQTKIPKRNQNNGNKTKHLKSVKRILYYAIVVKLISVNIIVVSLVLVGVGNIHSVLKTYNNLTLVIYCKVNKLNTSFLVLVPE